MFNFSALFQPVTRYIKIAEKHPRYPPILFFYFFFLFLSFQIGKYFIMQFPEISYGLLEEL